MIKLWSKFNVLVNSSCNFLCDKLFSRPEIDFSPSKNDSGECYGKRLKLSDEHWQTDHFVNHRESSCSMPMQKENVEISDDEDECCVIAEIPRRKKAESVFNQTTNPAAPTDDIIITKCKTFSVKKDFNNDEKEIEQVKVVTNSLMLKNTLNRSQISKNKFFNNQRATYGKVMKFRSLRNRFRKKMNFLQESYRLTEKLQYLQLLQSQTTCNLLSLKPKQPNASLEVPPIPIIDLTDEKFDGDDEKAVIKEENNSDEQDVQILREISGVRSFQHMLKIRALKSEETVEVVLPGPSKTNLKSLEWRGAENTISLIDDGDDNNVNSQESVPDALEERLRNFMQITGPTGQEGETTLEEQYFLPELTNEQEEKIKKALILRPSQEILVKGFGLQITRLDMHTLMDLNWLNDEVINFYMNLIMERSKNNKLPKVYVFNTFFYPKLTSSGYSSLRRWTKQVDIFSFDLLLVPIHLGMHWCLAVIDFRCKSIRYYDSIGSPNNVCLDGLLMYLRAESLDKKNKVFFTNDWEKSNVEEIPQQMNGSDCGVFSCVFAEHLARDCAFLFTQDDMPYFRKKMVIEILEKRLLT